MRTSLEVALVVAFRADGRVLVLQRRPDQTHTGCWTLPGGKCEPGEAPLAAARRELLEETRLAGRAWRFLGTTTSGRCRFFVFACRVDAARLEAEAVHRWVRPEELRGLRAPPANEAIFRLVRRALRRRG